jgi:group I intron endonuclease
MSSGIYLIENKKNGRKYIGSSVNIDYRLIRHKIDLNNGRHHSRFMQRDWNKTTEKFFKSSILEIVEPLHLIVREQHYLDTLKPEYNSCPVAGNSLGIVRSKEFREKLSKSLSGEKNPMFGRKQSEETKKKISAIHKGKISSEEHKIKIRLSTSGIKKSEETKNKMKIANKKRERLSNGQYTSTRS